MNAIRFIGAIALAGTLAGCAGTTAIDPGASATLKNPAPVKTVKAPPALPERTPPAPKRSIPTAPIEAYRSAPPPVAPPPVYVPRQTTVAAPRAPEPRYNPVETVAVAIPDIVEQPAYEPIRAPEPVAVVESIRIPEPGYTPIGDLDAPVTAPVSAPIRAPAYVAAPAPAPTYEVIAETRPAYQPAPTLTPAPTRSRSMAPIRDDPEDGQNGRRVANNEIRQHARKGYRRNAALRAGGPKPTIRSNFTPAFGMKLEQAALARINPSIRYDARYVPIGFPWGDVDETTGVCTDVVIRSYRKLGIDLQELVHEDMKRAFRAYPSQRIYGLKKADPNIDHRRVVNLEAFFERTGAAVPIGTKPDDFVPGDVLTWRLSGNEPHIGIVVSDRDPRTGMPLVVHNLGAGVRKEDLITLSPPVGHFRFAPDRQTVVASLITKR